MFEEIDCFQVLILSIFVGDPLTILFSIIEIQHRCHRIHPKSIHMELFNPEQGIRNQEVPHFIFPIIKNLCSPIRMFSLSWICVFISRSPIEIRQSMSIPREMCRNPIQNYANLILMKMIDHPCKVFWSSISRCRCIISRHLIAPGSIKWMLCNSNQFNMRIPHILQIRCRFLCELTIRIEALILSSRMPLPGTNMRLVN